MDAPATRLQRVTTGEPERHRHSRGIRAALGSLLIAAFALFSPADPLQAQDPLTREIVVPMHDGRVALGELVTALLDAYDLDATAIDVPDGEIDLRGVRGRLTLAAAQKLLLDSVRFRRSFHDDQLVITIDRVKTRELRRTARARLSRAVGALTGQDLLERSYEFAVPDPLDPARNLVVLVHGVESSPALWDDLRAHLAAGEPPPQIVTFGYPNDDSCERTAAQLTARLRGLGPDREVVMVGHSMGGLIARLVVEDPALDPGNVIRVIQIGTPNRGSSLAAGRFALEVAHLLRPSGDDDGFTDALLAGMRGTLLDGLGEAGGDLLPGSVFMTRLAGFERNPRVEYRVVLGTRGVLAENQLAPIRAAIERRLDATRWTRLARPRIEAWLADLDELVDGKGDGAVSVERGRLDGVTAELVPLDHVGLVHRRGMTGPTQPAGAHPVFLSIARWIDDPPVSR